MYNSFVILRYFTWYYLNMFLLNKNLRATSYILCIFIVNSKKYINTYTVFVH